VKISCKKDVHICHINFAKKMEQNSQGTTSQCQGHIRTQYYIYKAIPIVAEEMIEKKV
jgi:hypothetical protein